ncbi:hypothetical protein Q4Q35_02360 [Flavivirga aquimarina]|uniref:Outer membrane protein beta-barrel domain-containing protein n=1 Tax=Flavivirga aquimarina TaxID=2027862 RepID=A0ABT8W6B8_9FLAO|nr:hypothetical protein [Flavivirga aquimarina]MDO5968640.1 hypothetical protein [Flavivirga aquimarina]
MKKLFLLSLAIIGISLSSNAQDISENAIGLRLGDSDGLGAEVSYQRAIRSNNRLELDLGWRNGRNYDGFKLAGLYQWVFPIEGAFNWYVGAGGGIGSFRYDIQGGDDISDTYLFAAGDIGIEYNFDFPLLLSLDFRPEAGFRDDVYYNGNRVYNNSALDFDIAFSVRYQF